MAWRIAWLLVLVTSKSFAADSWLCTESSSQSISDHLFIACGVATGTLSTARRDAFTAATEEFNRYCEQTVTCKNKNRRLKIKRTDCEEIPGGYRCYRALEYEILRSASVPTSEDDFDKAIKSKEVEIDLLYKRLDKAKQLQKKQDEHQSLQSLLDEYEKTDENELLVQAEMLRQKNQASNSDLNYLLRLSIKWNSKTLDRDGYDLAGWEIGLERELFSRVSLGVSSEFLSKSTQERKTNPATYKEVKSTEFAAYAPIAFYQGLNYRLSIVPIYSYRINFVDSYSDHQNQQGYGGQFVWDWFSIEDKILWGISTRVGYIEYGDAKDINGTSNVNVSIGAIFGF